MKGDKTAKLKLNLGEEAQAALSSKLYIGEEIRWKGLPNSSFFLIDLSYKGLMWWSVFALIVPLAGSSPELTALLVLMLTWLEFKKQWNTRAYFITNLRAIGADKLRNGEWKFTDYPLIDLVSSKRTTLLKSLIMKFRTIHGIKTLKFPYLADHIPAMAILTTHTAHTAHTAHTDDLAIEAVPHDITGGVLHASENTLPAGRDLHAD